MHHKTSKILNLIKLIIKPKNIDNYKFLNAKINCVNFVIISLN